ncbi:MAG: exchange transporter [Chlamydiales bacterium]|jgi:AAA family ATP:ADP antiporter|nr:exchange transporter [Chlamydiales bacterium]
MSEKTAQTPEFTGWRALLWPIHAHETKKFLPMALIMFCILFNYTALRDTKDALVVNTSGAAAITFLKLYCVTPAAILFVIIYAKLTNLFDREKLFYIIVAPFLVFFAAFGFLISPNLDTLHPSPVTVEGWKSSITFMQGFTHGFIDLFANWSYSLFYVLAEIWGSAMIALLFWQFANQVTRLSESKRFYGLFAVIGNVALIFSGQTVRFCSVDIKDYFPGKTDAELWQYSLYLLMGAVVIMGLVALGLYRWMHTSVLTDPLYYDPTEQEGKGKKKKSKPGLSESIKIIFSSPELGFITILIMAYGVTINLVEVQWKEQLKLYAAGNKGVFNAFMGNFSTATGIFTILFGLFLGSNILRKVSWFSAAVITPTVILFGGSTFFIFIFAREWANSILESFSTTPIVAATFLGATIVVISKAVKYCLFDPTKEMAYIPLDEELKSKGKAAVDVIGGRAGKAGGAFVQNMLVGITAAKSVVEIAPIAFATFAIVSLLWIWAVGGLSKKVAAAVAAREAERQAAKASTV